MIIFHDSTYLRKLFILSPLVSMDIAFVHIHVHTEHFV